MGKTPDNADADAHAGPAEGFWVGGYYRHTTGDTLHVLGELTTRMYGPALIAEAPDGALTPLGKDPSCAVNFREITAEEFLDGDGGLGPARDGPTT